MFTFVWLARLLRSAALMHFHTMAFICCSGSTIEGKEFDSSFKRGTPTTFAPNQVWRLTRFFFLCSRRTLSACCARSPLITGFELRLSKLQ